jgi:hypothetical protein
MPLLGENLPNAGGATARRWRNIASAQPPLELSSSLRWVCTFGVALLGGQAQFSPLGGLIR